MRQGRIKIDPSAGEAVYHCISRAVAGEWLFGNVAREIYRRQLWLVAEFCGVQVITYAILANHFHVLVRVPKKAPVPDNELLRRYQLLHPKPTRWERANLAVVKAELPDNGPAAVRWRQRQLALMGDVSAFMKLWKQRYTIWFNRRHRRFGTLWASRFTSSLIEPTGFAAETVAAYIDLNPVRAGLVRDPKDYRCCGYAEAVAGNLAAQAGLASLYGAATWPQVCAQYREVLFATGVAIREHRASIPIEEFQRVVREKGKLPRAEVLRCRLRYFIDGGVLGSRAFVETQLAAYRLRTGPKPRTAPRALPAWCEWGQLFTLRSLRGSPIS
jgi:putative transposase